MADLEAETDSRDKLVQEIEQMDVYQRMGWPSDVQFLQFYEARFRSFFWPPV